MLHKDHDATNVTNIAKYMQNIAINYSLSFITDKTFLKVFGFFSAKEKDKLKEYAKKRIRFSIHY